MNATEETVSYRKGVIHYTITLEIFFLIECLLIFLWKKVCFLKENNFSIEGTNYQFFIEGTGNSEMQKKGNISAMFYPCSRQKEAVSKG